MSREGTGRGEKLGRVVEGGSSWGGEGEGRGSQEGKHRRAAPLGRGGCCASFQVVSLALAKHLVLLQSLSRQRGEGEGMRAALNKMEELRQRDVERLTAFQEEERQQAECEGQGQRGVGRRVCGLLSLGGKGV